MVRNECKNLVDSLKASLLLAFLFLCTGAYPNVRQLMNAGLHVLPERLPLLEKLAPNSALYNVAQ